MLSTVELFLNVNSVISGILTKSGESNQQSTASVDEGFVNFDPAITNNQIVNDKVKSERTRVMIKGKEREIMVLEEDLKTTFKIYGVN